MSKNFKLKSFGICNYKSIRSQIAWIDGPGHINTIIGQNNSGKSNILKYISRLPQAISKSIDEQDPQFEIPYNSEDRRVCIAFRVNEEYSQKFRISDYEGQDPVVVADRHGLKLSHYDKDLSLFNSLDDEYYRRLYRQLHGRNLNAGAVDASTKVNLATSCLGEISKSYPDIAKAKILYIPSQRGLDVKYDVPGIRTYAGSQVASQIIDIIEPEASHGADDKRKMFSRIERIIQQLLSEIDIHIINAKGNTLLFDDSYARLPCQHYGYGIQQLLVLACAIELTDASVICIDEPELGMHPTLQHRFLKYLQASKLRDKQFFLATHSTVFSQFSDDVSVYHITRQADGTNVTPIVTHLTASNLIDDLGIHASHLLQSNAVIWVEGPSDRILMRKWLQLINPDLIEGIHYSIVFYGGSNLFHHSGASPDLFGEDESELVQLLKVNRNALLFADRDRGAPGDELKSTLQRVIKELGAERIWVTCGRELENYIHQDLLSEYFSEHFPGVSIGQLSQFDSLPTLCQNYGVQISKIDIARFVASRSQVEHLNVLELKSNIERFANQIDVWNKPLCQRFVDLSNDEVW